MRFSNSVKYFFFSLALVSGYACSQGKSNIPEIDSLPIEDWYIKTPPLSYARALLYSALIPGGGQVYGRHNIRAGFLAGLEGFLLLDALYYKKELLKNKNSEIRNYSDSAGAVLADLINSPDDENLYDQYQSLIFQARNKQDVKMANLDVRKSEFVWACGLHFYGILDAMEIVYRSRRDSVETLDGKVAFWWGLAFPGGGQIYNRKFGKFGMLWMAMGSSIFSIYHRQQMVDYIRSRIQVTRYEQTSTGINQGANLKNLEERITLFRKRRNQYFWGIGLLYLYAVGDGIVDAVLNDFDTPDKFALIPGQEPLSMTISYRF